MLRLPVVGRVSRIRALGVRVMLIFAASIALVGVLFIAKTGGAKAISYITEQSSNAFPRAVSIMGFAFNPTPLTILAGDTVTWTMNDNSVHTATSDDMVEFDSGNLMIGNTFAHTFNAAGTFNYHCDIHPFMTGSVVVSPSAAGVVVAGRVLTPDGRGLRNAVVQMADQNGVMRKSITSSFGYYSFEDVPAGETYVVSVVAKRFTFMPRPITIVEDLTDLDFVAEP